MYTMLNFAGEISSYSRGNGVVTADTERMRGRFHPIGLGWRHRGEPVGLSVTSSHSAVAGGCLRACHGGIQTNVLVTA